METIIYVKEDFSTGTESYYFTDGKNELSKNYTYKQTIEHIKFLLSVGIDVQSNIMDIEYIRAHAMVR